MSHPILLNPLNSTFKNNQLCLYNNNIENLQTKVKLYLDGVKECKYKVYFKNNTSLKCEVLIFITHYETDKYLGYASNHLIIKPDKVYLIEKSDCLDNSYTFVRNYINKENVRVDLNSYITVLVYPEIEN